MSAILQIKTPVTSNVVSLSSSAMLTTLRITQWSGRKYDKKVSMEIDITNNTTARSGNFNKALLAGDATLSKLQKLATSIRDYHNSHTSPWSDTGGRILPTALFFDYKAEMARLEQQYNNAVDVFINDYPFLIQAAMHTLGDLFNWDDYPTPSVIRNKFSMAVQYTPIPETGDFRIDITNSGVQELREQYELFYNDSINKAMTDTWDRLYKQLSQLSNGLRNEEGVKGRVHDSVLENAVSLCDLLVPLNITQDTKLESMRIQLQNALMGVTTEDIRKSDYTRAVIKDAVDDLLSKF